MGRVEKCKRKKLNYPIFSLAFPSFRKKGARAERKQVTNSAIVKIKDDIFNRHYSFACHKLNKKSENYYHIDTGTNACGLPSRLCRHRGDVWNPSLICFSDVRSVCQRRQVTQTHARRTADFFLRYYS